MKKSVLAIVIIALVFTIGSLSTGCGKLFPTSPTAVPSPTATATADITADIIGASIACVNVAGAVAINYQVGVVTAAGVTVTGATVTVNGPGGLKTLVYDAVNYYYSLSSTSSSNFQFGQKYTVSVTDGGHTYAQDFNTMSDIAIPLDASVLSWTNGTPGTTSAIVVVIDPSLGTHTYGPPLTSPYNLTATGVFSATGLYGINGTLLDSVTNAFGGSSPASLLLVTYSKTTAYIKIF